ncbi:hypothetical protein AMAG_20488 [Allomyces macrogynus ATCC 38327]|uniref:Extracellular metalloproteinase n=1 Tax=Allomyces macrogynus (strain ATCC 38327) TaxID=578462 RepID=A0A0L0TD27_ALLM3|nr:hypothetical protein AMAG_20488 [Allomyces macrogynus ATCC 38327]|eukprot:KNE72642.1 hypothetical protein AMAG_20488 [Allomyces macrogynus ATCC 38327]
MFALAVDVLDNPTVTRNTATPFAPYVAGNPAGLRTYPYTSDMAVNPSTYSFLALDAYQEVHKAGEASSSVEEWVLNDAQQAVAAAAAAGVPAGPPPQMRLHRSLSTKSTASADSAAELQMLLSEFDEMEAAQANARRASVAEKRVTPAEFLATYADPDVLAELERLIAARLHGQQEGQGEMGVPEIKVTAASAASGSASRNTSARSSTVLGMVTHTLEVQPEAKDDDELDDGKDMGEE